MTSIVRGNTTELEVQYLLVKNGYEVFTPVNDGCSVDLVTIISGHTVRVQVKSSVSKSDDSGFLIELRSSNKKNRSFDKSKIDYLATTNDGKLYMIPINDVNVTNKLTVVKESRYKTYNGKPLIFADKYLFI